MTPLPHHIQQQTTDRKLEQLKQHGISVQQIVLRSRKLNIRKAIFLVETLSIEMMVYLEQYIFCD
jgi:hypothetical protein